MFDRQRSQRHLVPATVDHAALLDSLDEGVVVQDPSGVIRYINPRARALLRLGRAAVPFAPRLPWAGGEGHAERAPGMPVHDVFDSGEQVVARIVGLGRGAERRWLSLTATPWWAGSPVGTLALDEGVEGADADNGDEGGWIGAARSGRPDSVVVTMRDVTAVRRDRQKLARQARFRAGLVRLIEGSQRGQLDLGFHQRVLDAAVEVIPAAQTGSFALRQDDESFTCVAAVGLDLDTFRLDRMSEAETGIDSVRPRLVRLGQRPHLKVTFTPGGARAKASSEPQVTLSIPVVLAGRTVAYIALHNYDHPDAFPAESVDMARILANLIGALWRDERLDEDLREERSRVELSIYHDSATQLPNRVLLVDRLEQAMAQALRTGRPLALLFLDLDDFDRLNEEHGSVVGDQVLHQLGRRLQSRLRDVDTVARWGGDEFAILLTNLKEATDAAKVARKIVRVLEKPLRLGSLQHRFKATIGIDVFPHVATTTEELMRHADMALYRAKLNGKNRSLFFTSDMNASLGERTQTLRALASGLVKDQFVLHYQPRVELSTMRITAVEALLRWKRPGHGLVPAREIIELAEDGDLIHDLGKLVLEDACARARAWQDRGIRLRMAVNVSIAQLGAPGLADEVAASLARHRLDPDVLEIEVPEADIVRGPGNSADAIRDLKALGVRVSLDDFGTGYSSLGHLAQLAPSVLKIDGSFVASIDDDPTRTPTEASVVRAIVALGKSLACTLVAEGVESAAQHRFLKFLGCDEAQGYLYGRPMPADRLEPLLTRGRVDVTADPD